MEQKGRARSGSSNTYDASLKGVIKNNQDNNYCIANEFICGQIGRFLGLPVPPSGIVARRPGRSAPCWFATLNFNLTEDDLPDPDNQDLDDCAEEIPRLCTGVLLFDILIANKDRGPHNISVKFGNGSPVLSVFDHSHALYGSEKGEGEQRLENMEGRLATSGGSQTGGMPNIFLSRISTDEHFEEWFRRIEALPNYFIEDTVEEVASIGIDEREAETASDFLTKRKQKLPNIVEAHKSEFASINNWRVFQ